MLKVVEQVIIDPLIRGNCHSCVTVYFTCHELIFHWDY